MYQSEQSELMKAELSLKLAGYRSRAEQFIRLRSSAGLKDLAAEIRSDVLSTRYGALKWFTVEVGQCLMLANHCTTLSKQMMGA